jgi:hypothetical protein
MGGIMRKQLFTQRARFARILSASPSEFEFYFTNEVQSPSFDYNYDPLYQPQGDNEEYDRTSYYHRWFNSTLFPTNVILSGQVDEKILQHNGDDYQGRLYEDDDDLEMRFNAIEELDAYILSNPLFSTNPMVDEFWYQETREKLIKQAPVYEGEFITHEDQMLADVHLFLNEMSF